MRGWTGHKPQKTRFSWILSRRQRETARLLSQTEDMVGRHSPAAGGKTITESAPTEVFGNPADLQLMNLENLEYPVMKWALK